MAQLYYQLYNLQFVCSILPLPFRECRHSRHDGYQNIISKMFLMVIVRYFNKFVTITLFIILGRLSPHITLSINTLDLQLFFFQPEKIIVIEGEK